MHDLIEPAAIQMLTDSGKDPGNLTEGQVLALASTSIAVSLKRIADTLDGTTAGLPIGDSFFGQRMS